ncbi:MAG: NUDIX hydrolase [Alphaproteobacteria bacterium]|nr:MAG: NUDIX hydrolase [Alphaproteobacteria bacterium]
MDYPNQRPRDAATLIVLDFSGSEPTLLMGRRHERHVFMPGKFVFPGGRVDPGDSRIRVPEGLDPAVERKLIADMKGKAGPRRAQALGLAAIRETWEETGLLLGSPAEGSAFRPASRAWAAFVEQGACPALASLTFVCRAITPPRRPRRYDTRFFCISAEHIVHQAARDAQDNELLDIHWLTFDAALALELPPITKVVLKEVREMLRAAGGLPTAAQPVPYYYMRNGVFERHLI